MPEPHHIAGLVEQSFGLFNEGSGGTMLAMIRLLSGRSPDGKRLDRIIRPNSR
jgi:hypothetical protein